MFGAGAACIMPMGQLRPPMPWTLAVGHGKTPSTAALATAKVNVEKRGPLAAKEFPGAIVKRKVVLSRCPVQAVRA